MPKTEPRYKRRLHVLVDEEMYDFVKNQLNGGIGHHVRGMISSNMKIFNKELDDLERQLAEVEPVYLSLKKRVEQLRQEQKRQDEEKRMKENRIEDAKRKLLVSLKDANWDVERVPKSALKVYSDYSGLSIDELRNYLAEQVKRRDEQE